MAYKAPKNSMKKKKKGKKAKGKQKRIAKAAPPKNKITKADFKALKKKKKARKKKK